MSEQPEALRLADALDDEFTQGRVSNHTGRKSAAELRRLHAENEALRKAYWKMRNSAAGYSNYCDDNASTRRCERDYTEGEALYRAAIKAVEEEA